MRILISAGNSPLARKLGVALAHNHSVRLFDRSASQPAPDGLEFVSGDPCDPDDVGKALAGVQAILHLAPYLPGRESEADAVSTLDDATRGTFVLANAARQAGVERIILASTLDLFDRLPGYYQVNEVWRPRPTPEISQLAPWLAELSLRENSRRGPFNSICLRFGKIVDDSFANSNP